MTKVSKQVQEQIKAAMLLLGVKSGQVQVVALDDVRFLVKLDSVTFGIFDTLKNTFVD